MCSLLSWLGESSEPVSSAPATDLAPFPLSGAGLLLFICLMARYASVVGVSSGHALVLLLGQLRITLIAPFYGNIGGNTVFVNSGTPSFSQWQPKVRNRSGKEGKKAEEVILLGWHMSMG